MSKTRARNSKGRFIKGGGGGKKSKSKALAKRSTQTVVVRENVTISKKGGKKGGLKKRRSGGGGRAIIVASGNALQSATSTLKSWAPELVAAGAYGWLSGAPGKNAAGEDTIPGQFRAQVDKIAPESMVRKIGKPATHGTLLLAAGIMAGPGKLRTVCGLGAKAALNQAAHNLGAVSFDMDKMALMAGDDDDVSMGGEITDAEIVG